MGCWYTSGPQRRVYKKWRYPGVPIPERLAHVYSVDGKSPYHLRRVK